MYIKAEGKVGVWIHSEEVPSVEEYQLNLKFGFYKVSSHIIILFQWHKCQQVLIMIFHVTPGVWILSFDSQDTC